MTIAAKCAMLSPCKSVHRVSKFCQYTEFVQVQPLRFQLDKTNFPELDEALASGWFDTVAPDVPSPESSIIGHDVWAHIAASRQQQSQRSEAETLVLRGLAVGFPEGAHYEKSALKYMADSLLESANHDLSSSKAYHVALALVLWACLVRCDQHAHAASSRTDNGVLLSNAEI